MAVCKAETLHADGAVSLGPLPPGYPEGILRALAEVAGLLRDPPAGLGVDVSGAVRLLADAHFITETISRHVESLSLLILLRP